MPASPDDIATLITQLRDSKSPKRRSAAKALRRSKAKQSGPALLEALEREMADPRTWETQFEMALALGECGSADALPLLERISGMDLKATTVLMGVGNAITRIEQGCGQPFRSLDRWLTEDAELAARPPETVAPPAPKVGLADRLSAFNRWLWTEKPQTPVRPPRRNPPPPPYPPGRNERVSALIAGSLEAMADAGLTPDRDLIGKILAYSALPDTDQTCRWIAEACSDWSADGVTEFLMRCQESRVVETRKAAAAALERRGTRA